MARLIGGQFDSGGGGSAPIIKLKEPDMNDQTKDTGTTAADTGNAGAAAKPAGAGKTAPAAAAAKEVKAKKAEAPAPTVVVTGPEKGRWRIGRKFTREPVSISIDDLAEAEVLALQADPELVVQLVDAPH